MSDEPDRVESEQPLKWATTEELLRELSVRHEAFIFAYQKEQQGNAGANMYDLHWHGGMAAAHGLAVYTARCTAIALKALAEE